MAMTDDIYKEWNETKNGMAIVCICLQEDVLKRNVSGEYCHNLLNTAN